MLTPLKTWLASATILAALASGWVYADVLAVPKQAQATQQPAIQVPVKGQNTASVLTLFGEPNEKIGPVGDPPITRWVYDDFIVFFEYQWVLHSVITR